MTPCPTQPSGPVKPQHTPGPWFLIGHGPNQAISNTTGADWSDERHFVAVIDTTPANAQLIAGAPDLLVAARAALVELIAWQNAWQGSVPASMVPSGFEMRTAGPIRLLQAAIAQATGFAAPGGLS